MTVPYAEATTVGQGWWFSSLAEDAQIRFLHGNCSFAKPTSPLGDPVREDGAIISFSAEERSPSLLLGQVPICLSKPVSNTHVSKAGRTW